MPNRLAVSRLVLGPLQTNCYLLRCSDTDAALVIDPADDADGILAAAQSKGARIEKILLTHAHLDHMGALLALRRATGAPVLYHRRDAETLFQRMDTETLESFGRFYGVTSEHLPDLLPDVPLEEGDEVSFGQGVGTILHTPGHTPGSVTLKVDNLLFTGDTLFAQGVGRVDFPGGSLEMLLASLQRLFELPDECPIYPGHGPSSTIGREKRDNPYV